MSAGLGGERPSLTTRGRVVLGCGVAAVVFARLFGTQEVALLGGMLAAAAVLARVWVSLAGGPHVALRTLPPFAHAGERVRVLVELRPLAGARSGRSAFRERDVEQVCGLLPVSAGGLRVLRGSYELGPLVRGLLELGPAELVREDPFGLARRVDVTRGSTSLTVLAPPLELSATLASSGRDDTPALRGLRGGGHTLHGVREHQPGEALRGVHWPATAHRGRLMVKELEDPTGDELAVVVDGRMSAEFGRSPDSAFELALAAAGELVRRAHAEGRRVRVLVTGSDGSPATATERAATRSLLARARPAGERSPAEAIARLDAERVEVVTTRPADLVGALGAQRLGVVAIDPSGFDARARRDAGAIGALRASGARVQEVQRPDCEPAEEPLDQGRWSFAWRASLYALAAVLGGWYVRDLQVPALSAARLAAVALLATAPALAAVWRGRRTGLLALAPAALAAAWVASGSLPSAAAPLGGLSGKLADAPSAWVQVVLPFAGGEHPELRAAVLLVFFAWLSALAWLWLVRPRPLAAALLAGAPFALSATVYELPQYPWRALLAGAVSLAFLSTGRAAGGGRAIACALALLALDAGVVVAAVPAASRPAVLPWTTWTFSSPDSDSPAVDLVWDMRYQSLSFGKRPVEVLQVRASRPSYWRAVVLADFDGLRFQRAPQAIIASRDHGGVLRLPGPAAGTPLRAEVRVEATADPFLIAPGRPVRFRLPADAGGVDVAEDGSALLTAPPSRGLSYVAEGVERDPSPRTLRAVGARYPQSVAVTDLSFAGAQLPAFGASDRARDLAVLFGSHRGDPAWDAWSVAYARARVVTRGAASPYQAVVALEAWLRTTRAYDEHASLPARPDALARWTAGNASGYCQMFAASLAALARLTGVPARVVEGFTPGDFRGGVYHVTDRDAHAWVEAWFPGYGWLPFDATPGRDLPARASSSSAAFDGAGAQGLPAAGTGVNGRLQLPLARLRDALGSGAGRSAAGHGSRAIRPLLAATAVATLAALLVLLKGILVRRALPRDAAGKARGRVCAFSADQHLDLAPSLTPRELAAVVEQRFGVAAGSFARALERSAYGRPSARDDDALAEETAGLLRAVRRAIGWPRRFRGALSPRSVSAARERAR